MNTTIEKLPDGWAYATIPQIISSDGIFCDGDWIESKDQDPNGKVRLIQLADVGDGFYRNKSSRFLTKKKFKELRCTQILPGDVIVARMPDPLGRACIFPGDKKNCITVVDVCMVRTGANGPNHKWLMNMVNSPYLRADIASLQSGSTRKRISRKNFAKIKFPLPPLAEQERIVGKIEELFSDLDAGVAALKKVRAEIKRYRQAVLKHAFEGKLTAKWRKKNKDKIEPASKLLERIKAEREKNTKGKKQKKLPPLDTSNLPELPKGWEWTKLGDVILESQNGLSKRHSNSGKLTNVLRLADIKDFRINTESPRQIQLTDSEICKYVLERNNLVFIRVNGSVHLTGQSILFEEKESWCYCDHFIRLKLPKEQDWLPKSMFYLSKTEYFRNYVKLNMVSSAGQNTISQATLLNVPVMLFSSKEQEQIVSEIERRFSIADNAEKIVEQALKQAGRLRQSILKRAFEGKLVPQDPNDEPAEKLLERIKSVKK